MRSTYTLVAEGIRLSVELQTLNGKTHSFLTDPANLEAFVSPLLAKLLVDLEAASATLQARMSPPAVAAGPVSAEAAVAGQTAVLAPPVTVHDPLNVGHGHVTLRPDGIRARCGGPGVCEDCSRELARKNAGLRKVAAAGDVQCSGCQTVLGHVPNHQRAVLRLADIVWRYPWNAELTRLLPGEQVLCPVCKQGLLFTYDADTKVWRG